MEKTRPFEDLMHAVHMFGVTVLRLSAALLCLSVAYWVTK